MTATNTGFHVKVGEKHWCQFFTGDINKELALSDHMRGHRHGAACSHRREETAKHQVEWLNANGYPEAQVVPGFCDYIEED